MNNNPSLSERRLFLRISFLFNIVKGIYSLPHNAPIEIREYHHFSQSHSLTLKVLYAKTNAFYYTFFCDTLHQVDPDLFQVWIPDLFCVFHVGLYN